MKRKIRYCIVVYSFLLMCFTSVHAQSNAKRLTISDLNKLTGTWKGILTYVDYTSSKPYSMPADIIVKATDDNIALVISYEYPDEPHANNSDTLQVNQGGLFLNNEKIISSKFDESGDFLIVTTHQDYDGNDHRAATIKHTYALKGNSFSIKKEVKFKGEKVWIKRNEYQFSKEKKVATTSFDLYKKIEELDSLIFNAYNTQDMKVFSNYFTDDLEWYQDNGGLLDYKTVFENFQMMFNNENKLSRSLVKGSLEVHPIKNYGAIEIGSHQFKHMENGKLEIGTFKFLMIWKNDRDNWKISRVVSFDH